MLRSWSASRSLTSHSQVVGMKSQVELRLWRVCFKDSSLAQLPNAKPALQGGPRVMCTRGWHYLWLTAGQQRGTFCPVWWRQLVRMMVQASDMERSKGTAAVTMRTRRRKTKSSCQKVAAGWNCPQRIAEIMHSRLGSKQQRPSQGWLAVCGCLAVGLLPR